VDIIGILVAVLLVALVGWMIYQKMQRDEAEFNRRFSFDEAGIHTMKEQEYNKPFQFQGEGAQSTRPIKLESGDYKIRYHFPEGVTVKVELLSADDGDGQMIVLQSGMGEAGFTIEVDGRYLLDIEPQNEAAPWKLEISRLGLPSGYRPSVT